MLSFPTARLSVKDELELSGAFGAAEPVGVVGAAVVAGLAEVPAEGLVGAGVLLAPPV